MVQIDFLAANHVRIVGLCGQNKVHRAVIYVHAILLGLYLCCHSVLYGCNLTA